mgnify:CR=1 FL=1
MLSEDFIRRNKDVVDWETVSQYQILSEPFVEEFKDRVSWRHISKYQNLSETFIHKHANKVDWDSILLFYYIENPNSGMLCFVNDYSADDAN